MTKSPFVNAVVAVLYIVAVSSVMYYGPKLTGHTDTIIVPIAVISLFTLSAAVMGYLFLYQPTQLYLDGKKTKAGNLFLQTLGVFGSLTVLILVVLFLI